MPTPQTKTRTRPNQPDPKEPEIWNLRLYVAGQTPKSLRAFDNLKAMCEEHLKGRYQIIAIPTVVRRLPLPLRTIIGDLSNSNLLLVGLDLQKVG